MKKINLIGMPLLAIGFFFTACSDDGIFGKCGEEKEFTVVLTAGEIMTYPESKPADYMFYNWTTTISTNFAIYFPQFDNVCVVSPVHVLF